MREEILDIANGVASRKRVSFCVRPVSWLVWFDSQLLMDGEEHVPQAIVGGVDGRYQWRSRLLR